MSTSKNRPENKIDWQNTVVATAVSGLILVVVFLCPWRIESTGEIKWSPIYQQPMSYVRSYNDQFGREGSSFRIVEDEAEIAYGILALEVLALTVAGSVLYIFLPNSRKKNKEYQTSAGKS